MEITSKISLEIAECMAFYGDNPDKLMIKLESLVMAWYIKGQTGLNITCPLCKGVVTVYDLGWEAVSCLHCRKNIEAEDWII